MGHAGAIIAGGKGTAAEKMAVMKECGILVVESPADIGKTMQAALEKLKTKKLKAKKDKKIIKKAKKDTKKESKKVHKALKKAAKKVIKKKK